MDPRKNPTKREPRALIQVLWATLDTEDALEEEMRGKGYFPQKRRVHSDDEVVIEFVLSQ